MDLHASIITAAPPGRSSFETRVFRTIQKPATAPLVANHYAHRNHRPHWAQKPLGHGHGPHGPGKSHYYKLNQSRTRATATQAAVQTFRPGDLVEYEKDKTRTALGLVGQPDGKKNIWVSDPQTGRKASITPKQVMLHFPGPFTDVQANAFAADGAAAESEITAAQQGSICALSSNLDASSDAGSVSSSSSSSATSLASSSGSSVLADAWEMAASDNVPALTLSELAGLVLEDDSPSNLYRMYRMLAADKLYFKQVGSKAIAGELPSYTPRTPDAVETALKSLAAEVAAARDRDAWATAIKAALGARKRSQQPEPQEWAEGPHARRIAALRKLAVGGVQQMDGPTLALAQESLTLAGMNVRPGVAQGGMAPGPHGDVSSPLADAAAGLLVDIRALRQHEPLAALRRGVTLNLPPGIEAEAAALLASPPPDTCAPLRVDLTHLRTYTIDDASTTEVDDGLSVELVTGGVLTDTVPLTAARVWIHVADPTRWLAPGRSEGLVSEARARGRTLYFPWGSAPMFPRALAEGPFSLGSSDSPCDALSIRAEVKPDGSLGDVAVVPTRVRVTHKLTYAQADALMGGGSSAAEAGVVADLGVLRAVAAARRAYRDACGAIEIPLPEAKVMVEASELDVGRPKVTIDRISQWESPSRGAVAEMMIVAGEAAGLIGVRESLPLPFRSQPQPQLPPAHELEALPEGPCRGYALRRCMTRSSVASAPARHASLGLAAYVQVTSPIRRFPDIVAHANLKAHALGTPLPFSAADIDALGSHAVADRQRDFGAAERGEEQYWVAEYFRQRKAGAPGAPPNGQEYPATVLGWLRQDLRLASVLLDELGLEQVVKVDADVAPGDYLTLSVMEANPAMGQLRFFVTSHTPRFEPEEVEEGAGGASMDEGADAGGSLWDALAPAVAAFASHLPGSHTQHTEQRSDAAGDHHDEGVHQQHAHEPQQEEVASEMEHRDAHTDAHAHAAPAVEGEVHDSSDGAAEDEQEVEQVEAAQEEEVVEAAQSQEDEAAHDDGSADAGTEDAGGDAGGDDDS